MSEKNIGRGGTSYLDITPPKSPVEIERYNINTPPSPLSSSIIGKKRANLKKAHLKLQDNIYNDIKKFKHKITQNNIENLIYHKNIDKLIEEYNKGCSRSEQISRKSLMIDENTFSERNHSIMPGNNRPPANVRENNTEDNKSSDNESSKRTISLVCSIS